MSDLLRVLQGGGRPTRLGRAIAELGRLAKTLHGDTLARYARERISVVTVYPDGEERILTPEQARDRPAAA